MSAGPVLRVLSRLHVAIYRLSRGRLGSRLGRLEQVLLTTTGRRSGRPRTVPLVGLDDGERLILVASNGGSPTHPDWYLNLTADPRVEVRRGSLRITMRAVTAEAGERAALWPRVVAAYAGYARYQRRADREIPVVLCTPVPSM